MMAQTLRLPDVVKAALARRARESGRSQHDLIVEAVSKDLGLTPDDPRLNDPALKPPRTCGLRVTTPICLPAGVTSLDLLDREDRV